MIARFVVVLALLSLLPASDTRAQELPAGDPAQLGFTSEGLARIGEVFRAYVDSGRIAGAQGMIIRRGQIAYHETWGFRDREARDLLERDDIFRICSMTKPITSVAVMMLVEEGKLALTDSVARYLPALGRLQVARLGAGATTVNLPAEPPQRPITIQDLLRHTSGLTYGLFANTAVDSLYRRANLLGAESLETMVARIGDLPLRVHPGTRWIYSLSTDVLGRVVEVASGMPFDEFLRTRIFAPLGMRDTGFRVPPAMRSRQSRGYHHEGTPPIVTADAGAEVCAPPLLPSGGAGLASTARDYAHFAQMLLNGGELNGRRLLRRETVELMTRDHLGDLAGPRPGEGFGLGFAVKEAPNALPTSIGTYGWEGIQGTHFWIDPTQQLIGIFLVQIYPNRSTDFKLQFQRLVYEALKAGPGS